MRKAVLVTGGAGYIGSHTCKALAAAGYLPVTYDSLATGHREAVRYGPFIEADLANRSSLVTALREFSIGAVMHFAASANVSDSMANPAPYYDNNVANSLILLDCMRHAGVRTIVFSSSAAVYGTPEVTPIPETVPLRPVNAYGETKLVIERALRWYGEAYGLSYTALRYFNAAGADTDGELGELHSPETHLIPLILEAALGRRGAIEIYGVDYPTPDGTPIRDYIHVRDLAEAHVKALTRLCAGEHSCTLNLGTGSGYSVLQVIDIAERVAGRRVLRRQAKRRPGDPAILVADPARAQKLLEWTPDHSDLYSIIASAWSWHSRLWQHPRHETTSSTHVLSREPDFADTVEPIAGNS